MVVVRIFGWMAETGVGAALIRSERSRYRFLSKQPMSPVLLSQLGLTACPSPGAERFHELLSCLHVTVAQLVILSPCLLGAAPLWRVQHVKGPSQKSPEPL